MLINISPFHPFAALDQGYRATESLYESRLSILEPLRSWGDFLRRSFVYSIREPACKPSLVFFRNISSFLSRLFPLTRRCCSALPSRSNVPLQTATFVCHGDKLTVVVAPEGRDFFSLSGRITPIFHNASLQRVLYGPCAVEPRSLSPPPGAVSEVLLLRGQFVTSKGSAL